VREVLVDPSVIAETATRQVFLGAERLPSPKRRVWLHELLGQLPAVERVIMAMKLQGYSQREIAAEVGVSQPAVCYRLRVAQRRLKFLSRLPRPAVTQNEVLEALRSSGDPVIRRRDVEMLVRAQSVGFAQLEVELGVWRVSERLRALRVACRSEAPRVLGLIELLLVRDPALNVGRRSVYRSLLGDGEKADPGIRARDRAQAAPQAADSGAG
jgi:transcriptional regulator with XRE-family HTH domain